MKSGLFLTESYCMTPEDYPQVNGITFLKLLVLFFVILEFAAQVLIQINFMKKSTNDKCLKF